MMHRRVKNKYHGLKRARFFCYTRQQMHSQTLTIGRILPSIDGRSGFSVGAGGVNGIS